MTIDLHGFPLELCNKLEPAKQSNPFLFFPCQNPPRSESKCFTLMQPLRFNQCCINDSGTPFCFFFQQSSLYVQSATFSHSTQFGDSGLHHKPTNTKGQTDRQGLFHLATVDNQQSNTTQWFAFHVPSSVLSHSLCSLCRLILCKRECVCGCVVVRVSIFSQTGAVSPAEASCTAVSLEEALCVGLHSCALKKHKIVSQCKRKALVWGGVMDAFWMSKAKYKALHCCSLWQIFLLSLASWLSHSTSISAGSHFCIQWFNIFPWLPAKGIAHSHSNIINWLEPINFRECS